MGKVRLVTIQEKKLLPSILKGEYKPEYSKSYASEDVVSSLSYKYMLQRLTRKTGKTTVNKKDTCIWSWYQNPFLSHHKTIKKNIDDLVAITFEIDDKDVLFSDFDKWCEMFIQGRCVESVVDLEDIKPNQCIQAVVWGIPVKGIKSIKSFNEYIKESKQQNKI